MVGSSESVEIRLPTTAMELELAKAVDQGSEMADQSILAGPCLAQLLHAAGRQDDRGGDRRGREDDTAYEDDRRQPADVDQASDDDRNVDAKVRYADQGVGDQDDVLGEHRK